MCKDSNDTVAREPYLSTLVCKRLSDVPVFGIRLADGSSAPQSTTGYAKDGTGLAVFYMDFPDAEKARAALGEGTIVGVPLDTVYFNKEHCPKMHLTSS